MPKTEICMWQKKNMLVGKSHSYKRSSVGISFSLWGCIHPAPQTIIGLCPLARVQRVQKNKDPFALQPKCPPAQILGCWKMGKKPHTKPPVPTAHVQRSSRAYKGGLRPLVAGRRTESLAPTFCGRHVCMDKFPVHLWAWILPNKQHRSGTQRNEKEHHESISETKKQMHKSHVRIDQVFMTSILT